MIRQIIHIDEEKCNGCGLCANACKEAALGIVDGKAAARGFLRRSGQLPASLSDERDKLCGARGA